MHGVWPAWGLMWALAFSIFAGLKWLTWWKAKDSVPHARWRSAAYLLAWPGMDANAFLDDRRRAERPHRKEWVRAAMKTGVGAVLFWRVARSVPPEHPLWRGWIGMLGLVFLLHFGSFALLSLFWRRVGVEARAIMHAPLRAESLEEFWGKRWNLGFRQVAHEFVFAPLRKHLPLGLAAFAVFVVSGLIHDLVISLPARGGYGLPTAYFALEGLAVGAERSSVGRRIGLGEGLRGKLFALAVLIGPVSWLFHPLFVKRVMVPFMRAAGAL